MKRVHADLRHLEKTSNLELRIRGKRYPLEIHDSNSLRLAAASEPALALLPQEAQQQFTHFAHIEEEQLSQAAVTYAHIVEPEQEGVHLPKVVAMTLLIPESALRVFWRERLEFYTQPLRRIRSLHRASVRRPPRAQSAKFASYNIRALGADREAAITALVESQLLVTTLDTAATLVSHHPNLSNIQPSTAAILLNDHILPDPDIDPDQYNTMQILAAAITAAGSDWGPVIPCTDHTGAPLKAGYAFHPDQGGFKEGQPLYTYGLSDDVEAQLGPACGGANRSASNDMSLANKTWSPNSGTAALSKQATGMSSPKRPAAAVAAGAPPAFKWTVNEQTDHHGVWVDAGSIKIDKGNLSINASNTYLRTLYAGYLLLDENEKPIGKKALLTSVSATNTIMGIPVPTDPTTLGFDMGKAAAVQLYFGSLGTSEWDDDVSQSGALLTCLWQYGIPIVFMIAGKAITSTQTFNKIVNDKDLLAAALAVAFAVLGGAVPTAAALTNAKKVLFGFANAVLGLVVQKGLEKLGEWLAAQVAAGQISAAFGPVGWVMRAAAALLSVEAMAITTGEVLSSPACIKAKVSRAIDVTLTLKPDPKHGEVGRPETAVWPALAQKYVVTLEYKAGTSRVLDGKFPDTTSSTPIDLEFENVPAGGEFRIIAGVYSNSGWLAGAWQSDWTKADPNDGTTLKLGPHAITENLVPLAPDTQYIFKERIVSENNTFSWKAGSPPTATLASLNCSAPSSLCELMNITINNSAFQVGYGWRASGQNLPPNLASAPPSADQMYVMQNLSVLGHPGSVLKRSDIGFLNRPGIAYAPSFNRESEKKKEDERTEVDQNNFILDPRQSVMNLRQVVLDDIIGTFGLGDPNIKSWGQFPLANLDALAVHPSNMVLACSFKDSKLMLLPLPAAAKPDAEAPMALLVSGEGIRQGLTQGPKALTVAPDGRILVLESTNMRVQAFDTKGNPVPSFTPTPPDFSIVVASVAPALDEQKVPGALADALIAAGVNYLCSLSTDFVGQLDSHTFAPKDDPLIAALSDNGVILSYDPDHMQDAKLSATITVVAAGKSWIVTDPRGAAWQILLQDDSLAVYSRLVQAQIQVIAAGSQWLVIDKTSFFAWKLAPSSADQKQALVSKCLSYFPLRSPRVGSVTYLDMAVESQGYIYVLAYRDDGTDPADYILDIYAPDGSFCSRTPDPSVTRSPQNVVAGKIAVDIWRNLYGLTYETLTSPWGTPQPGMAHWMPTPPLFTLPLTAQQDLNELNIGAVVRDFAANGITLSNRAFIVVIDKNGVWQVKDDTTIYHIYRSGDGLQTYSVPA
jgi:hypothetical protein